MICFHAPVFDCAGACSFVFGRLERCFQAPENVFCVKYLEYLFYSCFSRNTFGFCLMNSYPKRHLRQLCVVQ